MRELSMHILDIAMNSVRAKASVLKIVVNEQVNENLFQFMIEDNGPGIPDEIFNSIKDPFTTSRTMRKVGLGIPLLNDTCEGCNGSLELHTSLGVGTQVDAQMAYDHIDRPPLGDIVSTIVGLVTSNENMNIKYKHSYNNQTFEFETKEIQDVLGEVSLSDLSVYLWMKDFVKENLEEIRK